MSFELMLLTMGKLMGALSIKGNFDKLVASLRNENGLNPEYVIALRDILNDALRRAQEED